MKMGKTLKKFYICNMENNMAESTKNISNQIPQDKESFHEFFLEYYAPLCRYATFFIKKGEVEDLVQDFFTFLWESRNILSIHTSLKSFLYISIRNRCLSRIREDSSRKAYQDYIYDKLKNVIEYPDEAYFRDISEHLADALKSLTEQDRKIFELSRFTDMTNKQIGDLLGVTEKTVEYHVTKTLKYLREHLKDYLYVVLILVCSDTLL